MPVRLHADSKSSNEESKISFRIEDDFNKKLFRKKDRARYLVDSRLKEWGSGGRDATAHKARMEELKLPELKASQVTQQIVNTPLRTATVRYMAKSYLQNQKTWNEARDNLVSKILNSKDESPRSTAVVKN